MLLAVGERVLGDLSPQCVRMAGGFAGGVGSTHEEMCGALSGGVMVIGGLLGRDSLSESDEPALTAATRYRRRFLAEFGDTQCARLREKAVYAAGGLGSCAVLVERAATILLELVAEAERIEELERRIADLKRRWPVHSVPPAMVQRLDELEEELQRAREEARRRTS